MGLIEVTNSVFRLTLWYVIAWAEAEVCVYIKIQDCTFRFLQNYFHINSSCTVPQNLAKFCLSESYEADHELWSDFGNLLPGFGEDSFEPAGGENCASDKEFSERMLTLSKWSSDMVTNSIRPERGSRQQSINYFGNLGVVSFLEKLDIMNLVSLYLSDVSIIFPKEIVPW